MKLRKLRVATIKCPKCREIIWSKHRHDYRECKCGEVAIDGGRDYTRVAFKGKTAPRTITRTVEVNKKEWHDPILSAIAGMPTFNRALVLVRECWPGGYRAGRV